MFFVVSELEGTLKGNDMYLNDVNPDTSEKTNIFIPEQCKSGHLWNLITIIAVTNRVARTSNISRFPSPISYPTNFGTYTFSISRRWSLHRRCKGLSTRGGVQQHQSTRHLQSCASMRRPTRRQLLTGIYSSMQHYTFFSLVYNIFKEICYIIIVIAFISFLSYDHLRRGT